MANQRDNPEAGQNVPGNGQGGAGGPQQRAQEKTTPHARSLTISKLLICHINRLYIMSK